MYLLNLLYMSLCSIKHQEDLFLAIGVANADANAQEQNFPMLNAAQ